MSAGLASDSMSCSRSVFSSGEAIAAAAALPMKSDAVHFPPPRN